MCTYLTKRGATYYFRRVIPSHLRASLGGRVEFMWSLRTKDREQAKRLIPTQTAKSQQLLDDAEARASSAAPEQPATPRSRRVAAYEAAAWEARMEAEAFEAKELAGKDARREDVADLIKFFERRLKGSTAEMPRALRAFKYMLEGHQFDKLMLTERLASLRHKQQQFEPPRVEQDSATANPPSASGTMLDTTIVNLWAAERKVAPKGRDAHKAVAQWFYTRVGRKPVADISRKDVLAFKTGLIDEGQSLANIKVKLSRLRTLLQWAADNDHVASNVGTGITIKDTDAAKNRRREFDLGSLNSIFSSPVFSAGERPAGGKGEASYWLPLLALFTGARLEELGQLRPADVASQSYPDAEGKSQLAWFVRITEDADEGLKIKNAASERSVPLHPTLEGLGFLLYVAAAKAANQERLFPSLKPDVYGKLSAKWGEWFSLYKRNVCGVTDRRMVFHSFRHTFKQYARLAGILEGVQRQIMGHSSSDVADEYGSGYPLHQVVAGMALYKVPGLTLPAAPLAYQ